MRNFAEMVENHFTADAAEEIGTERYEHNIVEVEIEVFAFVEAAPKWRVKVNGFATVTRFVSAQSAERFAYELRGGFACTAHDRIVEDREDFGIEVGEYRCGMIDGHSGTDHAYTSGAHGGSGCRFLSF